MPGAINQHALLGAMVLVRDSGDQRGGSKDGGDSEDSTATDTQVKVRTFRGLADAHARAHACI